MPRDYVVRLIEEMGLIWRRVLRYRELEQFSEAFEDIDKGYGQFFGMNARFIDLLSDDELLALVETDGIVQPDRCYVLGWLLASEGILHDAQGHADEAYWRFERAMLLFARLLTTNTSLHPDVHPRIADTAARLAAFEPSSVGAWALVECYTALGRYADAEEALHLWLERRDNALVALEQARTWYTRLAALDDAVLEAGALPRTDVAAGLAFVAERMGV